MKTVLVATALLIGAAAVSAQAQTTNSTPNSTQTRTGAGVDPTGTSGMGSGTTTDSRATRAYPANGATNNTKTMNRRRSSAQSTERTGAGIDPQGTSGMGSGTTTDSRATRAYPADAATTNSMSTQSSMSKKTTTKTRKSSN
ncbi:hypothetical protein [uncultured Spirosoma sp.]|uniref:hypothetical protein n=1 Tax=uncultured Spirosoma sp. TaxID=278208 RepID=UPI00258CB194|nr:hypothetical protein [uncultured Spirosoma sp.]